MLTASLSAFTNQICGWDFEHNFEISWQLTCEVLVWGKQNFQEPFEFTNKKNNKTKQPTPTSPSFCPHPPPDCQHFQKPTYIVLHWWTSFPQPFFHTRGSEIFLKAQTPSFKLQAGEADLEL